MPHIEPPLPIPFRLDEYDLEPKPRTMWVSPRCVAKVIERNAGWLQYDSVTSEQIAQMLFPDYDLNRVPRCVVFFDIGSAMTRAGYDREGDKANPTWTFPM